MTIQDGRRLYLTRHRQYYSSGQDHDDPLSAAATDGVAWGALQARAHRGDRQAQAEVAQIRSAYQAAAEPPDPAA